jgi:hypothetical protein
MRVIKYFKVLLFTFLITTVSFASAFGRLNARFSYTNSSNSYFSSINTGASFNAETINDTFPPISIGIFFLDQSEEDDEYSISLNHISCLFGISTFYHIDGCNLSLAYSRCFIQTVPIHIRDCVFLI